MEALAGILLLAIITQFVVDRIKEIIPVEAIGTLKLAPIYAAIVGLAIALSANIDLLAIFGFAASPPLGQILAGLSISGGSTAVHEFISKIRESRLGDLGIIDLADYEDKNDA